MYITYFILGITILVSLKAFNEPDFKRKLLMNPYDIVHNKKWYRTFTHAFIHADFMHLGFNMYVLYLFGVQSFDGGGNSPYLKSLEPSFVDDFGVIGYWYFFLLYVGGILFSSIYAIYKHQDNPNYNSLGASGAVSSVIFGAILLNPHAELGIFPLPFMLPAYIFGPLLLVAEYFMSKRGGTNVAHDAHIAGALFGILFTIAINPNYIVNFFNSIF
jgi:membrane associated rhomboid family serine protease